MYVICNDQVRVLNILFAYIVLFPYPSLFKIVGHFWASFPLTLKVNLGKYTVKDKDF